MFNNIRSFIDAIRGSLWFWPVLMTLVASVLAQGMIYLDHSEWFLRDGRLASLSSKLGLIWLFGAGADGARSLLAAIAASMISIAATVFSITIVALSLAAGQMGPRLLRTFMRDRGTQASLGMFIATFAYCIVVLGVVDGTSSTPFVPRSSVSVAVVLAFISLGVLIYFIHNVARSIQAPQVIAVVGRELENAVDDLFPNAEEDGSSQHDAAKAARVAARFAEGSAPILARTSGYLTSIDHEGLVKVAAETDAVLWLDRQAGDHVIAGTLIARVWPVERSTTELRDRVHGDFAFGPMRTPVQDLRFLINQLVEIAQRALSPGINDPITAEACVDYLGVALGKLASRPTPSALRKDEEGIVRVIAQQDTFASVLDASFDPIRNYSRTSLQVSMRLAVLLTQLASLTSGSERRTALLEQARMIRRGANDLPEERDRGAVEMQCLRAIEALGGGTDLAADAHAGERFSNARDRASLM